MIITGYISKENLHKLIDERLKELGVTEEDYPLHAIDLMRQKYPNLCIEIAPFPTLNLGGMLYKGEYKSIMALNAKRSEKGRNFDCMHEMCHYWYHPSGHQLCFNDNYFLQNKGIEWQANEGAAHALMPEKLFRIKYKEFKESIAALSDFFLVGEQAIKFRIDNLKLLRSRKQNFKDKIIDNDRIIEKISKPKRTLNVKARYCAQCRRLDITYDETYCKICGLEVFTCHVGFYGVNFKAGVPLNRRNKAIICPRCGSDNKNVDEENCMICGANLYQKCTNPTCSNLPDSNARFCSGCGQPTTFFRDGLLVDWEEEREEYLKNF